VVQQVLGGRCPVGIMASLSLAPPAAHLRTAADAQDGHGRFATHPLATQACRFRPPSSLSTSSSYIRSFGSRAGRELA